RHGIEPVRVGIDVRTQPRGCATNTVLVETELQVAGGRPVIEQHPAFDAPGRVLRRGRAIERGLRRRVDESRQREPVRRLETQDGVLRAGAEEALLLWGDRV